ncbi:MAG: hypothetical protein ACOYM1_10760 [Methylovulum sp.]
MSKYKLSFLFIFLLFWSSFSFAYSWDYAKMRCETTSSPRYNYCFYNSSGSWMIVRNNGIIQTVYSVDSTLCPDGVTYVFDPSTCPTSVTCPDGSTAATLQNCPSVTSVTCPDGSTALDISSCSSNSSSSVPITTSMCSGLQGYPAVSTPQNLCDIFKTRNNTQATANIVSSNSDGSLSFTCLTSSNSSLGSFSCSSSYTSQCSSPNFWSADYSSCQTAPTCTAPQLINTSVTPNVCYTPNANCSSLEYDNYGTCTTIPNCGIVSYFSVSAKACVSQPSGSPTCITGNSTDYYCSPYSDCVSSSTVCSDNSTAVTLAETAKAAVIADAKATADAAAASAAASNQNVAAPLSTAELSQAQASANVAAAQAALSAAQANTASTSSQVSAAAQAYGESLNALAAANTKASNVAAAAAAVASAAAAAAGHAAEIPGSATTGAAQNSAGLAGSAAGTAAQGLADALAGGGTGSGSTLGQDTSLDGVAKEGTLQSVNLKLQGIDTSLKGIKDNLTPGASPNGYIPGTANGHNTGDQTNSTPGDFVQSNTDAQTAIDDATLSLSNKMDDIKNGVASLFSGAITSGASSLPTITYGTIKGVDVTVDLNNYAPQLSILSIVIMALAWLTSFSIIMSK